MIDNAAGNNQHGVQKADLVIAHDGTVRQMQLELGRAAHYLPLMTRRSPFRYFKTSPEIIRLAVMLYIPYHQSELKAG